MARIARIVSPGKPHLICQRSDRTIFTSAKRRGVCLKILADCSAIYRVKVLAWSVLRREAYFVVVPPSAEAMSSFMRVVHTRYARRLHAAGFEGEVTPHRFASCPLDNPTALEAIKFVESRPVAEKMATTPMGYAFSSAAVRGKVGGEGRDILSVVPAITGKVRNWAQWHAKGLDEERAEYLAMRMRTGKPAGASAFIRRLEQRLGMNLSRGRGRPKGS